MAYGTIDVAPLLYVSRAMERSLLLLIYGLLLAIAAISVIPTISMISCVDLSIIMLFFRALCHVIEGAELGPRRPQCIYQQL
jgi:hypothetical protein